MDVATISLGLLSFGEATGYEIRKNFEDGAFGHFYDASYGAIYPALAKLEEQGFVSCRTEHGNGRPERKIYAITDAGLNHFEAQLAEMTPPEDRYRSHFLAMMMFADRLPPEKVSGLLDRQIMRLRDDLEKVRGTGPEAGPASHFVRRYGEHVLTAALAYLEGVRATGLPDEVAAE